MMMRTAPIHAIFVALMAVFVPVSFAAQEPDAIPMPAQISELAPTETAPWAAPSGSASAVSDWDLYAGSVYANTSPIWVQAEYLLWWLRGNSLPPLVTTGPLGPGAGALEAPGTQVLFGGERVGDERGAVFARRSVCASVIGLIRSWTQNCSLTTSGSGRGKTRVSTRPIHSSTRFWLDPFSTRQRASRTRS